MLGAALALVMLPGSVVSTDFCFTVTSLNVELHEAALTANVSSSARRRPGPNPHDGPDQHDGTARRLRGRGRLTPSARGGPAPRCRSVRSRPSSGPDGERLRSTRAAPPYRAMWMPPS